MSTLTNARLVLDDEVVTGNVAIENGIIAAVGEGAATGEDMEGDYLVPGLVELHTDHLETHVAPRPGVRWHLAAAIQAHDAQIAASGITTVLDALRIGLDGDNSLSSEDSRQIASGIVAAQAEGRLRAEHRFHLRCEVSEENVTEGYALFDDLDGVELISLMDHSPGQRQFRSIDAYRAYFKKITRMGEAAFEAFFNEQIERAQRWSDPNRRAISERARARGIVIASHDDATEAHVADAVRDGVTLAEFPTTLEAAEASRRHGIRVMMGGPNVVRGGSHTGNAAASELADRDALDILSSDYVPFSILQGAFALAGREGWGLPRAIATVTAAPAAAIGLTDRGRIAEGLRADVVRIACPTPGDIPVVRGVWREGRRVA